MFINILITIFSIVSLLVIHEFGHFIIAKKFGVKVEEFGVGYPPRLYGKKIGETLYSINLLPLGAFVKIPGADGDDSHLEDYRRYSAKPIWQRTLIILGGVLSFWLVAIILLSVIFTIGTPQAISDNEPGPLVDAKVQIIDIAAGSPAEIAGLRAGDTIKEFKIQNLGFEINLVKEVQELTEKYKGEEVVLTIQRGKEVFTTSLIPRLVPPEGEGAMGVALVRTAEKKFSWWYSPIKGIEATANLTGAIITSWGQILGNLIRAKELPSGVQLVGPVGLGVLINQAAQLGLNYFLQFIAMISIYLAIFNLLPIPALDGGKLLFLGIEKIKGKAIPRKLEENVTAVFFSLLIILMIFVTIKDIMRLF